MRRDTITISLPKAMTRQVDHLCKAEQRTRSELFREALRSYVKERVWLAQFEARAATLPVYTPTKRELEAIRKGREEMQRGEYLTLDEFDKWLMGGAALKAGREKSQARAAARTRTTLRRAS
jgi:predicted transcriptional regulator